MHIFIFSSIEEYIESAFLILLGDHNGSEEEAHARIRNKYLDAVKRIQKRLGGDRCKVIQEELEIAFDLFQSSSTSDVSGFCKPIQTLLEDFYDPMYDYQMSKRQGEILFCGNQEEIVEWAKNYSSTVQN